MGSNDAKEMLEVAQEECIRLERALALAERHSDRDRADMLLIAGQRDAALAVIDQIRTYREDIGILDVILAHSPSSALAKVKADAWDEGAEAPRDIYENVIAENPYRTETT